MLQQGLLIGNEEEIWTHQNAWRALGTFRECVDAITLLIGGSHGVEASFVKACVMQAEGLAGTPYALDEIAEFMVTDSECRHYWQTQTNDDRFPDRCPFCGGAGWIGFNLIECKGRCRGR
jgi:hypothetical protein